MPFPILALVRHITKWHQMIQQLLLSVTFSKYLKIINIPSTLYLVVFSAADDIPHADEVRTLIKDIWDLRIAKLRKSIDIMVSQQEVYARVS